MLCAGGLRGHPVAAWLPVFLVQEGRVVRVELSNAIDPAAHRVSAQGCRNLFGCGVQQVLR